MKLEKKEEANRITITVELSNGCRHFDQRVIYRFAEILPILQEKYNLENYKLITGESTRVLSNFTAAHIGQYVFERMGEESYADLSKVDSVVKAKTKKTKKTKKTTKSEE